MKSFFRSRKEKKDENVTERERPHAKTEPSDSLLSSISLTSNQVDFDQWLEQHKLASADVSSVLHRHGIQSLGSLLQINHAKVIDICKDLKAVQHKKFIAALESTGQSLLLAAGKPVTAARPATSPSTAAAVAADGKDDEETTHKALIEATREISKLKLQLAIEQAEAAAAIMKANNSHHHATTTPSFDIFAVVSVGEWICAICLSINIASARRCSSCLMFRDDCDRLSDEHDKADLKAAASPAAADAAVPALPLPPPAPTAAAASIESLVSRYRSRLFHHIPSENGIVYDVIPLPLPFHNRLFAAGWYGRVFSTAAAAGAVEGTKQLEMVNTIRLAETIYSACLIPSGTSTTTVRVAAGLFKGSIAIIEFTNPGATDEGKVIKTWHAHTRDVSGITAISSNIIVSCGEEGTAYAWNVTTGSKLGTYSKHTERMNCTIALHNDDSQRVALGSSWSSGYLVLWDPIKDTSTVLTGHTGGVWGVTSWYQRIASGSNDHTVRIWNTTDASCVTVLRGHSACINCLTTFANGALLVSGGDDHKLKLWSTATGEELIDVAGEGTGVKSLAVMDDDGSIVFGSLDRTLRIWRPSPR